jgi:ATP-dependent exoDNAse (exonuclease V) beta subunit
VPPLLRLESPLACAAWQAPSTWPAAVPRDNAPGDALAAAIGTLVHACLEQIADHVAVWDAERLETLQAAGERWLASHGWARAEAAGGAARAVAMLRTALASTDGQWVLRARAGAASELALTRREKVSSGGTALDETAQNAAGIDRLVTRVVDRSFIDDGARWIIDYKTADLGAKADDAILSAHAEKFRPQLETYALLFAGEVLPRRLAVFYVAHGRLITLKN